jgi:hypothetical protein
VERPLDSWWYPTAGVPGWACGVSGAASRQLVVPHRWGTRLGVWCKCSCRELPLGSWWYPTAEVPGWACGVSGAASRQLVVPHRGGTRLGVWSRK